mgnify:FL=1
MNDILINAFVARIKAEDMTIEQVPIPYKEAVEEAIEARFEEMD